MNKLILLLIAFLFSIQAIGQQAKYDLRFNFDYFDCHYNQIVFDLEVRAHNPSSHFNIADINIRFSYGNALANPVLVQELDLSGTIFTPQYMCLFEPHHLNGTSNNVVSYNVVMAGGTGYPLDDVNFTPIGKMSLDVVDYNLPLELTFLSLLNGDFPSTTVVEKYNDSLAIAQEGTFYNSFDTNICTHDITNIRPKLFLEGPFDSNSREMNIGANMAGLIPTSQPFAALGIYNGPEITTTSVISNHNIVDWVLVQFRKETDSTVILSTKAGLLDNEGNVTDVDGTSPISISSWIVDKAFISIVHRNHLSIMTANPIDLFHFSVTPVDFTTIPLYGNNSTKIDNGTQIMWAGDSDTNGAVNAGDRSSVWNDRNLTQYLRTDYTLDGVVNATDRSVCWNNRNLTAQLP